MNHHTNGMLLRYFHFGRKTAETLLVPQYQLICLRIQRENAVGKRNLFTRRRDFIADVGKFRKYLRMAKSTWKILVNNSISPRANIMLFYRINEPQNGTWQFKPRSHCYLFYHQNNSLWSEQKFLIWCFWLQFIDKPTDISVFIDALMKFFAFGIEISIWMQDRIRIKTLVLIEIYCDWYYSWVHPRGRWGFLQV